MDTRDADDIRHRLTELDARIQAAAAAAGRPGGARLLLATKTVPAERIAVALASGYRLIGENRVQELVAKYDDLAPLHPRTHLIGHLQKNKVNSVVGRAVCVQSVDSIELVRRLDRRAAELGTTVEVMVQVNVSGEETKSGVTAAEAPELAAAIAGAEHLQHTGYMTVGLNSDDSGAVRAGYEALAALRDELLPSAPAAVELSMGMSGDFEVAIAAGATMVRLGSAVFGARAR